MDQVSYWSGVGSEDVTDETASLDLRSSTDEDDNSDFQAQCMASPQAPLPSYKMRLEEFRKLFKEVSVSERLLVDYPCALQRDILLQGRLYLSENWICFYSNVFRGTKIMLILKDIRSMTREKTARLIPNAIQICTSTERYFFTSFSAREKSYQGVFRLWQNTLLNKPLTSLEVCHMVRQHYGYDLGLSHEEMESLQILEANMQTSQTARTGSDDNLVRLERPPTLRLPGMENAPMETSTPQGEDLPYLRGSPILDDSRNIAFQRRSSPVPLMERFSTERTSKQSSNSLDFNANENDASDHSGSESDDEEEKVGQSQETSGRLYLNKVFRMSASKMFELLFTDSSFIRRFMNVRKMTNVGFDAWQKDASGNMKRSLSYTITISNPLVGKFSTATEYQTLYKESKENQYYVVESEVYTHDVPYHDYFYTQNRYYIISNSKRKCRLKVYTDVKYKKQPWGLVKSFITKNSWSGIEDNFKQLEAELMEEEAEMNERGADSGKMAVLRRRRRTFSRSLPEHIKPNKQYGQDAEQMADGDMGDMEMGGPHRWNISTIVAVMSVILLILAILNLGLFMKLWAMEDIAHRMYMNSKHRLRERTESSLQPEFIPKQLHGLKTGEEIHLLRTVLQDSINLLEQLRASLMVLQHHFAVANQTSAPQ
ncbi:protein Aster-C isoform X1 [Gouania willdenowi]|nr:protein Aster-C isoform X1 [Gouania willdenowi]